MEVRKMKIKIGKNCVLVVVGMLLLSASLLALPGIMAEVNYNVEGADPTGDIYPSGDYPEIDITYGSTAESGDDIVITITVVGTIMDDDSTIYMAQITIGSGDTDYVMVTYTESNASYVNLVTYDSGSVSASKSGSTLTMTPLKSIFGSPTKWDVMITTTKSDGDTGYADSLMLSGASGNGGDGDGDGDGGDDPGTETPTNTAISVSVTKMEIKVEDKPNNKVKVTMTIEGTTSGVDHVELLMGQKYTDGTWEWDEDWIEPFEFGGNYFKSTSDGNWETWQFYSSYESEKSDSGGDDIEDIKEIKIYARAFDSDDNWNQGSKSSSVDPSGTTDGDDDEDDFPMLLIILLIIVIVIVVVLVAVRMRSKGKKSPQQPPQQPQQ
jgi:hypothetical protein